MIRPRTKSQSVELANLFFGNRRQWGMPLIEYWEDRQRGLGLAFVFSVYERIAAIRSDTFISWLEDIQLFLNDKSKSPEEITIESRELWYRHDGSFEHRGLTRILDANAHARLGEIRQYETELSRSLVMTVDSEHFSQSDVLDLFGQFDPSSSTLLA